MTNRLGIIKIERRTQPEWALTIILFITMFNGFFINVLHVPSAIKYAIDAALVFLFVLAVSNLHKGSVYLPKEVCSVLVWVAAFFVLTIAVYLCNFQSPLYYLWGLRNNFRFYLLFFFVILFFSRKSVSWLLKFIDVFFWSNAVMCLIQFLFFGLKGDFLGGFFGTEKGCNGYLNIFLVVFSVKAVIFYLNKKENLTLFAAKASVSLLVATLAEIKFFYAEFLIILALGIIINDFSFRTVLLILVGAAAVTVSVWILGMLFPNFAEAISLSYFLESSLSGGYASAEQLNRLTVIPLLSKEILTTIPQRLFGLGLGNCELANFEFLKTPFYYEFGYLRYYWFSTAFLFLETGLLGLMFFFGFFIILIFSLFFIMKKNKENKINCQMAIITAVLCIIIGVYNSSLRNESGFLMYFILALPFIAQKEIKGR